MNLGEVFRFAFGYQTGRAWTWICFVGLVLLTAMMAAQVQGDAALDHGYFFNAPFVIANGTQVASLLWLPIVAALTGAIAARDFESRMSPEQKRRAAAIQRDYRARPTELTLKALSGRKAAEALAARSG